MFQRFITRPVSPIVIFALGLAFASPGLAQDTVKSAAIKPAPAQSEVEAERTLSLLLADYHGVPSRSTLEAVSPKARDILVSFARDEALFPLYRHRALSALAAWPDDEVRHLMFGMLSDKDTAEPMIHHLLGIVASAFGHQAVFAIEPFLTHADVQMRISAVAALAIIAHDDAQKLLAGARERETSQVVRERLDQALMRVQ
jgi:HEAT repeat protein